MAVPVNIHEAKSQLSKLIQRVEAGEEVVIARAGKPVARLTGLGDPDAPTGFGFARGRGKVAYDFHEPMDDAWLDEMETGGMI
ncbi:MAG: type II toxin-antitoxin system prevent-host-death family antitoxin [Planctomycetes bacterium]|nr:type II toxin-antitoxin system prevent-host-death family antitoxin [Planctomycetota bacterium]